METEGLNKGKTTARRRRLLLGCRLLCTGGQLIRGGPRSRRRKEESWLLWSTFFKETAENTLIRGCAGLDKSLLCWQRLSKRCEVVEGWSWRQSGITETTAAVSRLLIPVRVRRLIKVSGFSLFWLWRWHWREVFAPFSPYLLCASVSYTLGSGALRSAPESSTLSRIVAFNK